MTASTLMIVILLISTAIFAGLFFTKTGCPSCPTCPVCPTCEKCETYRLDPSTKKETLKSLNHKYYMEIDKVTNKLRVNYIQTPTSAVTEMWSETISAGGKVITTNNVGQLVVLDSEDKVVYTYPPVVPATASAKHYVYIDETTGDVVCKSAEDKTLWSIVVQKYQSFANTEYKEWTIPSPANMASGSTLDRCKTACQETPACNSFVTNPEGTSCYIKTLSDKSKPVYVKDVLTYYKGSLSNVTAATVPVATTAAITATAP